MIKARLADMVLFMTAGSKEELKFFIKGLRRALKEPVLNEEDL